MCIHMYFHELPTHNAFAMIIIISIVFFLENIFWLYEITKEIIVESTDLEFPPVPVMYIHNLLQL